MTLPDAKAALNDAGVTANVKSTDTVFGVLVEENFVVCEQKAVNENTVRLEVAKHGC